MQGKGFEPVFTSTTRSDKAIFYYLSIEPNDFFLFIKLIWLLMHNQNKLLRGCRNQGIFLLLKNHTL